MSGAGPAGGGSFRREAGDLGPPRLVATPAGEPLALFAALAHAIGEPFALIYVLLRSGTFRPEGRYQTQRVISAGELDRFLARFGPFLSGDGRHGLWLVSAREPAAVTLDRRGQVELHGPADRALPLVAACGLVEGPLAPRPPAPIGAGGDAEENALLAHFPFTWFPLEPSDELLE